MLCDLSQLVARIGRASPTRFPWHRRASEQFRQKVNMTLNRTAIIQRYLDAVDEERREIHRVPFRGEATALPVIRVDVKELRFNVNLGRLILDRIAAAQHLEPDDPRA